MECQSTCYFHILVLLMYWVTWLYLHDLTSVEKKERFSSTLPFMSPHLATVSLRSAAPHQMEPNSPPLLPWGGGWLSRTAHLPCCFYYDSHLSLPPVAHLSPPGSQDARCHDTGLYCKRVERYLLPSSYQRVYMYG